MKKSSSFKYNKNLFLDTVRMEELHNILLKYCKRLVIQAETVREDSVEFDSYEELLKYDNFGKDRIRVLKLVGYPESTWNKIFSLTLFPEFTTKCSVDCTYAFSSANEETVFQKDLTEFFNKSSQLYIPSTIGNMSFLLLWIMLLLFWAYQKTSITLSICVGIGAIAELFHIVFLYLIWHKLFPLVSFCWGEAVNYYGRLSLCRKVLFGSVLGAGALGIVVNYLSKYLFG